MLVGAPLFQAQRGAHELRKIMLAGDPSVLETVNLDTPTTLAQVLKQLQRVPPLALLKLFNKQVGDFVLANLIQHSDDLDFIQDVLNLVGSCSELTPILHAVLAGFNRRKNYGSYKHGQQSISMDRLRFSHLASANDYDYDNTQKVNNRRRRVVSNQLCQFYQRSVGCRNLRGCTYQHKCIICGSRSHGAFACKVRKRKINSRRRDRR